MSATFHWIAWNSAIFWPNACRSLAYFVDSSRARWAIPRACAAIPIRPPSRVAIAIVKPLCRSPSRLSLGIRQPSKPRVTVSLARIPILSSFFRTEKPFASVGTTNAEISCFFGPVRAYTTTIRATDAFVANVFVPRKTHSSRSRVAVARIAAASDPLPGSARAYAPSHSPRATGSRIPRGRCAGELGALADDGGPRLLADFRLRPHGSSDERPPDPPRSLSRAPSGGTAVPLLGQERGPDRWHGPVGPCRDFGVLDGPSISRGGCLGASEVDGPASGRWRELNYCALRGHLRIRIRVARLSARVCTDADGSTDQADSRAHQCEVATARGRRSPRPHEVPHGRVRGTHGAAIWHPHRARGGVARLRGRALQRRFRSVHAGRVPRRPGGRSDRGGDSDHALDGHAARRRARRRQGPPRPRAWASVARNCDGAARGSR